MQARWHDLAQAKGELLLLKHKLHRERIGSRPVSRESRERVGERPVSRERTGSRPTSRERTSERPISRERTGARPASRDSSMPSQNPPTRRQ